MILFLISTLFDPADKIFGLKVPLYIICWMTGIVACLINMKELKVSLMLIIYIISFIGIPIVSIFFYYISNGSDPFKGFELLPGYIFISFAALIYITEIDILKYLCIVLSLLALSILALTAIVLIYPEFYMPAHLLGNELGMFSIDSGRDYGTDVVLFQMYFVTSPMLTISIAYYFNLSITSVKYRWFFAMMTAISICAMAVAGTRNNILTAAILPLTLLVLYSRQRLYASITVIAVIVSTVLLSRNEIGALFDPSESSNSSKLIMLNDYTSILSDPMKLIFGSGLGAFDPWTEKGHNFITELTYFEIIRNFGVVLGGAMILLLIYPIIYAFLLSPSYKQKNMIIGYLAYLVMSMTNPLLFSSMGIMYLAIIMSNISQYEKNVVQDRSFMRLTHNSLNDGNITERVHSNKLKTEGL
jgi:hypothetical protein